MKFNEIINSPKPVLIDFHATWCGPCKVMSPILQEVKQAMGDKIQIVKIDVDKNPHISQQYRVQGVPTLMIFKEGKALWKESGVKSKKQMIEVLEKFM